MVHSQMKVENAIKTMHKSGAGNSILGLRPQDRANDPIADLPPAGSEYQISMGRILYGLPSTKEAKFSTVQQRGKRTQVLPSQGTVGRPFSLPKRA